MSCRYKGECPSYSGWCEGLKQDFSKCVSFLINAYEHEKNKNNKNDLRRCKVNGRDAYFHTWEHFSNPVPAQPFIGGSPAGVYSEVFGIVEYTDDGKVDRVNSRAIQFL